jgi:hypothetical protein
VPCASSVPPTEMALERSLYSWPSCLTFSSPQPAHSNRSRLAMQGAACNCVSAVCVPAHTAARRQEGTRTFASASQRPTPGASMALPELGGAARTGSDEQRREPGPATPRSHISEALPARAQGASLGPSSHAQALMGQPGVLLDLQRIAESGAVPNHPYFSAWHSGAAAASGGPTTTHAAAAQALRTEVQKDIKKLLSANRCVSQRAGGPRNASYLLPRSPSSCTRAA